MTVHGNQAPAAGAATGERTQRGGRRTLIGRVASAKMQKTVVVEVVRSVRHPVYGKFVRIRTKYKAHDEKGEYKAGDLVEIREHKPISREKRWTVVRLIERPVET
jgi:small subunit ribosomal protein S17